jgi:quinol monooxygenase YgiN
MIAIIAEMPIKEGQMDQAVEAAKAFMEHVKTEEGCLYYTANVDTKNAPNTLVFMERYKDKEAIKIHGESPQFQELFAKVAPLLDGEPVLRRLTEVASI